MAKTNIHVVLDRTGSMAEIVDDAIGGFNTFLERTAAKGQRWWVWLFDSEGIDLISDGVKAKEVERLNRDNYVPRSMTPLYDAIGKAIDAGLSVREVDRNILVILTDGYENASREYSLEAIKSKIADLEEKNWQIVYLAANQDAFAAGGGLGMTGGQTITLSGSGASYTHAYDTVVNTVHSYSSTGNVVTRNTAVNDEGKSEEVTAS